MDREGFRNRLKQYKEARGLNPLLKYWEWKETPKYEEGTGNVQSANIPLWRQKATPELLEAFWTGDTQKMADIAGKQNQQVTYTSPEYTLDEVVVTAKDPNKYTEWDLAKDVASFTPGLGDAMDVYELGKSVYDGNYSLASMYGMGLLLPNWLEKSGKYLYKGIRNNWRRLKRNIEIRPWHLDDRYVGGISVNSIANDMTDKALARRGIHQYEDIPFMSSAKHQVDAAWQNAIATNSSSSAAAIDLLNANLKKGLWDFDRSQIERLKKIFFNDPRYADYIVANPNLNPLSPETVDAFIRKQNTAIRGVYSTEDSDELIENMLTVNPSDVSKKVGGDRLDTGSTGVYTSNSGEIANRFQRSHRATVRSDVGLLYKDPATTIDIPIEERLAAERRRIFPFDIDNGAGLTYSDLADMGYVAKESQYTNRFGNKLPGYERAYISSKLDTPALKILDIQTTKTNLENIGGRWGFKGVSSNKELEDKLFEGFNIGNSYGDYLHFMRTMYDPRHVIRRWNPDYSIALRRLSKDFESVLNQQSVKVNELRKKARNNPMVTVARNTKDNAGAIAAITSAAGLLGGITGYAMFGEDARLRNRVRTGYMDDTFLEFSRTFASPEHFKNTDAYRKALLDAWNSKYPNKQYADGGEVIGPPTYEEWLKDVNKYNPTIWDEYSMLVSLDEAQKVFGPAMRQLPGYDEIRARLYPSMVKPEPNIANFVEDTWENENPNNLGLKNGKYYPHKSPEGGSPTIGPGFKIGSGSHNITAKEAKQGVTKYRLDKELENVGKENLAAVNKFINNGLTTNPADTISPQIKQGLMDLRYQVGPLGGWKELQNAVLEGDIHKIQEEAKVKWKDKGVMREDTRRNNLRNKKYFHY